MKRRLAAILGFGVLGVSVGLLAGIASTQAPPSTDIYLADLDLSTSPPSLGNLHNLTQREGYDNQPFFEPEGIGLLYTSARENQTDIYRIDLTSLTATQLTETPDSEYSPTVMPAGLELSVIRVEDDGTQRLWAFRRDGSAPRVLLQDVAPVGYHAWGQGEQVLLYVLGEPATLQLADVSIGSAEIVATDIGRSLHRVPGRDGFSFIQQSDAGNRIRFLAGSGVISDLGPTLADSQDMTWTPDGRIVMASGTRIYIRHPEGNWQLIADLERPEIVAVTRLAVNAAGDKLALVALRPTSD